MKEVRFMILKEEYKGLELLQTRRTAFNILKVIIKFDWQPNEGDYWRLKTPR